MSTNNTENGNSYVSDIIGVVFLLLIGLIFVLFCTSNAVQSDQGLVKLEYDTVTLDELTVPVNIKVRSVETVYNIDGTVEYNVYFNVKEYGHAFKCVIPEDLVDKLDTNAVYKGNLKFVYFKEYYDNIKLPASFGDDIKTKLDQINTYRFINDIEFYFQDFIVDGLVPIEDILTTLKSSISSSALTE